MSDSLILRKSVDALSSSELGGLRDAYARMMRISDNRGYNYWAGIHGVPQYYCWHHSRSFRDSHPYNLFLPWHRAFIKYFELALRDQNPQAALAWWDWTAGRSIPAAFSTDTAEGQPNPLYKAHMSVPSANPPLDRDTRRFPGEGVPQTVRLPDAKEISDLYEITHFGEFSRQLEGIHDRIHGWTGGISIVNGRPVGGDMGVIQTSAYDPIFWVHHCMIDRVWYLWQLKNGINNLPTEYLSVILAPFRYTVRDVLNIGALGYEYATSSVSVPA